MATTKMGFSPFDLHRDWGSSNWWQNTRLAYWSLHIAGDFDLMKTIFDYYHQMLPFLER